MTKPSLTPHTDAAVKAIELGRERVAEQHASSDPFVSRVARIRAAVVEPLVLAIAREMDNGADHEAVYLALVNVFANMAVSAGAVTCNSPGELRAAGLEILVHAAQHLARDEWQAPKEADLVRVAEPSSRKQ